jgi:T-complex protein 1 subunit delta
MDKMIKNGKGEVTITNDGATILKQMEVLHPTAKMLVELSAAQDIEAGDGTTSVVVLAGSLLNACQLLLEKGIHPTIISEGFKAACDKGLEILDDMSIPVDMNDKESLIKAASTSLASKMVSQHAQELAPLAVDAVLRILDHSAENVNLNDIRVSKKLGATVDETEMVDGLVFAKNKASHQAGGPTRI